MKKIVSAVSLGLAISILASSMVSADFKQIPNEPEVALTEEVISLRDIQNKEVSGLYESYNQVVEIVNDDVSLEEKTLRLNSIGYYDMLPDEALAYVSEALASKTKEETNAAQKLSRQDVLEICHKQGLPYDEEVLIAFENFGNADPEIQSAANSQPYTTYGLFPVEDITAIFPDYFDNSELTSEERELINNNPGEAYVAMVSSNVATDMTKELYGNINMLGCFADGYRHALWNAIMSNSMGKSWAEAFGTAHERRGDYGFVERDGYVRQRHCDMDLHNNAQGRAVVSNADSGKGNLSKETLSNRVKSRMTGKNSGIIRLHGCGYLCCYGWE